MGEPGPAATLRFGDDVPAHDRARIASTVGVLGVPGLDGAAVHVLAGGASNANYVLEPPGGARLVLRIARPADRFGIDRFRGLVFVGIGRFWLRTESNCAHAWPQQYHRNSDYRPQQWLFVGIVFP